MTTFRAMWPITDEHVTWGTLCRTARADLPLLAAQAKARIVGAGRFYIAPSAAVPGSGRVTESVLVFEARAEPIPARPYHAKAAPTLWRKVA